MAAVVCAPRQWGTTQVPSLSYGLGFRPRQHAKRLKRQAARREIFYRRCLASAAEIAAVAIWLGRDSV